MLPPLRMSSNVLNIFNMQYKSLIAVKYLENYFIFYIKVLKLKCRDILLYSINFIYLVINSEVL